MSITPVSPVVPVTAPLAVDSEAGSSNSQAHGALREDAAPAEETPPTAVARAVSTGYGSLLLPSTGTSLLKLMAEEAVPDTHFAALTPRQRLARYMALSIAIPQAPPQVSDANYYSLADLDLTKAATGYNFVVLGGTTLVVDDEGHPAPEPISQQVQAVVAKISGDRAAGLLSGDVTPEYLHRVFAEFADADQPFPEGWLESALGYCHDHHAPGAYHANLLA